MSRTPLLEKHFCIALWPNTAPQDISHLCREPMSSGEGRVGEEREKDRERDVVAQSPPIYFAEESDSAKAHRIK